MQRPNGFPARHKMSAECLLPVDVDVDGVYAIKILSSPLRRELEEGGCWQGVQPQRLEWHLWVQL